MRNPGAHMGVCEDGSFCGSFSGGCIENAVVAEAMDAIIDQKPRVVRFGEGSRYLDVKLPCGGGLDIHFQPLQSTSLIENCSQALAVRAPFSIAIDECETACIDGWRANTFDEESKTGVFGHWPKLKLLIVGHGATVEALALLGQSIDCEVQVLTPDERVKTNLAERSVQVTPLERTTDLHLLSSDRWTAIVFLFHDHDWEIALMERALELPHFYLGAMGGRQAHIMRSKALRELGVTEDEISRINAPIGLFHSSRDPQTLALSALGQIVQAYQTTDFASPLGG